MWASSGDACKPNRPPHPPVGPRFGSCLYDAGPLKPKRIGESFIFARGRLSEPWVVNGGTLHDAEMQYRTATVGGVEALASQPCPLYGGRRVSPSIVQSNGIILCRTSCHNPAGHGKGTGRVGSVAGKLLEGYCTARLSPSWYNGFPELRRRLYVQ